MFAHRFMPFVILSSSMFFAVTAVALERIQYNHPGLVVDLGVGLWAWPVPMDFDEDGDMDLVVSCPDKPYNGIYFFENPDGQVKMPVFKPAVRIGAAQRNIQISFVDNKPRVLVPGRELLDVRKESFSKSAKVLPSVRVEDSSKIRANQWKYADYDGDGRLDLIVGVGDWEAYGWDRAYDERGRWTNGPLHGWVFWLRNVGTNEGPDYAKPKKIEASGEAVDVYGMPSPNLADFDGDGDLDLLCGEFVDGFTYFENQGSKTSPEFAAARRLPMRMDLCMITPTAVDWDGDGDVDLIVGDEDGRVALVEHTGKVVDSTPVFLPPKYFQQQAADVKFGALVTPVSFDWDGDGDDDLVCGNTAGYVGLIENLNGANPPKWAAPRLLEADGQVIRIMAGPNGSIQGPCERKWGYTTFSVADWNHDHLPDLVVNSIWGKVLWYENVGSRNKPLLTSARPVEVEWQGTPQKPAWNWWTPQGRELATQWRTTPVVVDWNEDELNDLVMLDHEGFLALFERRRDDEQLRLLPPQRIFVDVNGKPLQLNSGVGGRSGRRKMCFADWDGDGRKDLLINSKNVNFYRNVETRGDGRVVFQDTGQVHAHALAGHTTSPTVVDWDKDGKLDLLIGAEDGFLYYLKNANAKP